MCVGDNLTAIEKKLIHYASRAISDFNLIEKNDRVMVCLSGGKDSYTMLTVLQRIQKEWRNTFDIFAYTLDQSQPGWDDSHMRRWLSDRKIPHEIEKRDTYSVVKRVIPEGKTYCSLCSRLRRGNIYRYAIENKFNKIALGHHRDDCIQTLLMSILYAGQIKSMPPKLLSDDQKNIVIRPMVYCQESDIKAFASEQQFPIIPCNLCGSQENLTRNKIKKLIEELSCDNPKIPSNILHALQSVQPSQLMDKNLWDFNQFALTSNADLSETSSSSSDNV
ncbi:MAG: tRNA 2-thiocytidine(32) synthetase TtcA [Gammaproteobacteria bacterium RIFCSPLOWO2_02_FULL_42_14]|nr:MAG: tRNA 2-thiocytidine(32) synthetase TtcA [Gammaproteobacteria bacterium RIFCSPHIGHO2_02_FULL_42_43]OGT29010.1 MAG: tRNA 2-thiocytidine(32) synthetase TtcA [Gammaproteobacteria bacterium RIFCSPHIGHO2_01_FULL_42_8]OGT53506.1 MAG: tRNA 2-thiocytidine(32) synthetase TtcA [Gammaproteobacteria bacterium RIFCSPHIGHO2_12_FULL_41_25]OGT61452.1 MAG: tRNA 2-thiocytidine(32) synthetase TtcA [Gammaproteobacteria bacterium RIFCSPLOWO2_02_FULL_42_14]OGT86484.1 MAG: tRNA 2-thiocytidine(32) synthetase Tt